MSIFGVSIFGEGLYIAKSRYHNDSVTNIFNCEIICNFNKIILLSVIQIDFKILKKWILISIRVYHSILQRMKLLPKIIDGFQVVKRLHCNTESFNVEFLWNITSTVSSICSVMLLMPLKMWFCIWSKTLFPNDPLLIST